MSYTHFFYVLVAGLLIVSCGTKKNAEIVEQEEVERNSPPDVPFPPPPPDLSVTYIGIVDLDEECGHVIKVQLEDGQELSFAPNNLNDLYKKPGMRVRFSTLSQLDEEKKCGEHYQINLERITPLRE